MVLSPTGCQPKRWHRLTRSSNKAGAFAPARWAPRPTAARLWAKRLRRRMADSSSRSATHGGRGHRWKNGVERGDTPPIYREISGEPLTAGSPGTCTTSDHRVRSNERRKVMSYPDTPLRLIERRVGYRRERIRQLELAGKFPRRIPMSARRNLWIESEIDDWIREHIAAVRCPAGTLNRAPRSR